MPWRAIRSLANSFDDSMRAAAFVGPKIRSPAALKQSTTPVASDASGPTTVSPTPFSAAKSRSRSTSVSRIATHSACRAMPALPGAHQIFST